MHFETLEPNPRWRSALAPAAVGIALLGVTPPLLAQKTTQPTWLFQAFATRKEPSSSPLFGGIGFTKYGGVFGFRIGGALHLRNDPGGNTVMPAYQCGPFGCRRYDRQDPSNITIGAWTADFDLLLEPLRALPPLKGLLLGFSPYGFVGVGGYGVHLAGIPDSNVATLSYGVGAHHDLLGPLGIQAEARYRRPLESSNAINTGLRENLEYSVGFTVGFGGHSHHQTKTITAPPPRSAPPPDAWSDDARARFAARVLEVAESYLNTQYRYGGSTPYGGFDAAGFVQYVFARQGVRLPRTAREIADMGDPIPLRVGSPRPGDLLFFASDSAHIDHVAIYAGHERIIHSSATGGGVRYDVLGDGDRGLWFAQHLISARRIVGGDRSSFEVPRDDSFDPPDRAPAAPRAP